MRQLSRWGGIALAIGAFGFGPLAADACHVCRATPCRLAPAPAPAPALRCVTEMVPYTVMRERTRCELVPITKTVTVNEPEVTYFERQRVVCRPQIETSYVEVKHTGWKAVYDTTTVNQTVTVCRPITTTEVVTATCLQPRTSYVNVAVPTGACGLGLLCGRYHKAPCGGLTTTCRTVAQTTLVPVPVTREVVRTRLVSEVQTRQVPVTHCRMVPEERVEQRPVTHCRIVRETITEQVPVFRTRCVTKQVTQMVPVPVKEVVPVTCYRPVQRLVPCEPPAPVLAPTPTIQGPVAAPTGQGPSKQG